MSNSAIKKKFLFFPLLLVEIYLGLTLLIYEFGPIDWQTENAPMFWIFLLLYHAAFIAGYVISIQKIKLTKRAKSPSEIKPRIYSAIIWCIIALCVILACVEYRNLTHAKSFIPYELPANFIKGLLHPADQYYTKGAGEFNSNKLVTACSALFSFIYVSLIPLLVVEWKRLSAPQKFCIFALILFKVIVYVSIGTNKGIFDTMFSFASILLVLILLNVFHHTKEHIDKRSFIKIAAFTLFLSLFALSYFTSAISSRLGQGSIVDNIKAYFENRSKATAIQPSSSIDESAGISQAEEPSDNETITTLPGSSEPVAVTPADSVTPALTEEKQTEVERNGFLQRMYRYGADYLTQGYYGMSLALDEDFTTTYGIGSSQFLTSNFRSLLGIDVSSRTYQHKITEQWHESIKWHSFYSYVANDVSFYGVIAVMFLIGLFFGCICKDIILNNSFIGKMLMPLFAILFMYMPANNQVFTAMATCTAFLELSFLWILSKINWKYRRNHAK